MSAEVFTFHPDDTARYGLTPAEPGKKGWKNGMVVRMPNHLGDAVMALPALNMLKSIIPEYCGLFVVAPFFFRQFYAAMPCVDAFVALERPHRNWSLEELKMVRQLYAGPGVLFNNSLRDAVMFHLARVSELYGTAARGRTCLLAGAFKMSRQQIPGKLAQEHLSARYCAMAEALGAQPWDGTLPEFRFVSRVEEMMSRVRQWCLHPRLLALGAGAAYGEAKRWSEKEYARVAGHWIEQGGVVVVLGSSAERPIGENIVSHLKPGKCANLCGLTDLKELMVLLRFAKAAVCNDSGIMHLAAALGTPGVAVFGSTDFTATGPISSSWKCLYKRCECAPCFEHQCPRGDKHCLEAITAEDVIAELDPIINKK